MAMFSLISAFPLLIDVRCIGVISHATFNLNAADSDVLEVEVILGELGKEERPSRDI